ncbi:hypothetical protein LOTGIDRAFT_209535 [Lottia gigantea]|uniref:Uncharacterized protein n=1 Tax=Lottia gigantea TaxID=225164 RepID=V4A337_LOTGI|nr:hypothetical protein LOTGIDRAFT_209535 [Lottia gigantea]ESO91122.1 hypothetical protein LOTGIDRAFT_209535 [Lottia gigantea]
MSSKTDAKKSENGSSPTDGEYPHWMSFKPGDDQVQPIKLQVKGTIPTWVKGSLFRNGSGLFEINNKKVNHVFDGFAVLLRFTIQDGGVMFQSHLLDSETWEKCYKANRIVVDQFASNALPDPCKSIFSRIFSLFQPPERTDNTAVNIVERGDELWAFTETPKMNRVDPKTLSKSGQNDLTDYLAVHLSTAHPHLEPDGTLYNLATCFNYTKAFNIVKIPPNSNGNLSWDQMEVVGSFPSRWKGTMGYNHSFGMAENFFVVLEQPYAFSVLRLLFKKLVNYTVNDCIVAYPQEKTLFNVMTKSGVHLKTKYMSDPLFVFHFINCYEKNKQLVVDFVFYDDVGFVDKLYMEHYKDYKYKETDSKPKFGRFVLPLDVSKVMVGKNLVTLDIKATATLQEDGSVYLTPDLIIEEGLFMELPQINYQHYNSKEYRYVYASTIFSKYNKIHKLDLKERKVITYTSDGEEFDYFPGEPIFVPKPGGKREDEGVLLAPIMSNIAGLASYLVIIDAETMKELARAVLPADVMMTLTFHGTFSTTKL